MKKFSLSIPEPCHQNWDAMTQADKGRFCNACQKTVIDFSGMSDRQIAEFFKKPAGDVCGRLHHDQLDREMIVPRKRIPWVKYFFQVTWPAFVLFLKSCGSKENIMGKMVSEPPLKYEQQASPHAVVGMMFPEITPVEAVKKSPQEIHISNKEHSATFENLRPMEPMQMGDTVAMLIQPIEQDLPIKECSTPMDTVMIKGGYKTYGKTIIAGAIVTSCKVSKKQQFVADEEKEKHKTNFDVVAYPNPVKPGAQLTISVPSTNDPVFQTQLFAASGALISALQSNSSKGKTVTLSVPSFAAPGIYFVRVMTENKKEQTVKIIIAN